MATLTVTTTSDVVANDGQLSLREAVAQAGNGDTIVFATAPVVSLSEPLRIAGKTITIDGTGSVNQVRGVIIAGQIVVAGNADVTITRTTFSMNSFGIDAPENAEIGEGGTSGENGLPGITPNQPGTKGEDATDGQDGTGPQGSAFGLFGNIVNLGKLTLDYVQVQGNVFGGDGATGGFGGGGGGGGRGGDGNGLGKGANAGLGGNGGSATDGSDGADAMAGIWNRGQLVLKDTLIHGNVSTGGTGGDGGRGGNGGDGGSGGNGGFVLDNGNVISAQGGNSGLGGNGGNAGDGGKGGSAFAGLLNEGQVIVRGAAIFYDNEATGGAGGEAGDAGEGGLSGPPGRGDPPGLQREDGVDGAEGQNGANGSAATNIIGAAPTGDSFGVDAHFHAFALNRYLTVGQTVLEGTSSFGLSHQLTVSRFGDAFDASSVGVGVRIVEGDLNANDFTGNVLPRGTLAFGNGGLIDSNKTFTINLKAGFKFNETSTIEFFLRNPSAGDLLGSDDTATLSLYKATLGNDLIRGTQGDRSFDSLSGFDGDDRLLGLGGDDALSGDLGNDTLEGGAGIDTLFGGLGRDIMSGGSGADLFQFSFADHSTATQRDLVRDFSRNQGDELQLTFDADTVTTGFQELTFIGNAGFGNEAGELRFGYLRGPDVTRVSADTNGDGVADFVLDVAGRVLLTADDFGF